MSIVSESVLELLPETVEVSPTLNAASTMTIESLMKNEFPLPPMSRLNDGRYEKSTIGAELPVVGKQRTWMKDFDTPRISLRAT